MQRNNQKHPEISPPKMSLITRTEARILIYLETVQPHLKYAAAIENKLNLDHGTTIRTLQKMETKKWILHTNRTHIKVFYQTTEIAPLAAARQLLQTDQEEGSTTSGKEVANGKRTYEGL